MKFRNGSESENIIYVGETGLFAKQEHLDGVYKWFCENPRKAVFEQFINDYLLLQKREERINALPVLMEILKLPEGKKSIDKWINNLKDQSSSDSESDSVTVPLDTDQLVKAIGPEIDSVLGKKKAE